MSHICAPLGQVHARSLESKPRKTSKRLAWGVRQIATDDGLPIVAGFSTAKERMNGHHRD
jgi:hypothetical protein